MGANTESAAAWPADSSREPRETSANTTSLIVGYLRNHGGEEAVAGLLAASEVPFSAAQLADESRWFSFDTRLRLFEAAVAVTGDPDVAFRIGSTALENKLHPSIVLLMRALGTPRQVVKQVPAAVTKFTTTSSMELIEIGATHATIRHWSHDGYPPSRFNCDYARGLISTVPLIFSLPAARVLHPACESRGDDACVYEITWQSRAGWRLPRRRRPDDGHESLALRRQLEALQSAASELVSSDDVGAMLARITERAAAAVVAPAYLLAVHAIDGGEPLVHSEGLETAEARHLAQRLLDGEDLGPRAVVVEVATARRTYGKLAAMYAPGQTGMAHESSLLAAYAAHAAAGLELLLSLESSRREGARAHDLLGLAHRLAACTTEADVAEVVVEVLPLILGTRRSTVLRWDPSSGLLQALAAKGFADHQRAALFSSGIRPDDTPELAQMLTRREPTALNAATASPGLARLLAATGAGSVLAVPLVAGEALLGVLTTDSAGAVADGSDGDVAERMRGVADQAASAMQNARLLSQVRYQADHDGLTGLPNRSLFMQSLEAALAAAGEGTDVAVLFCDLDGFKQINDQHGHAAGDEVLRQVAARLRGNLRAGSLVARLSGDEFALVVQGRGVATAARDIAERVTDGFAEPFRVDGRDLRLSTSIGVAVQFQGEDGDRLLRRADAAMYTAKLRGRNLVAIADETAQHTAPRRSLVDELRPAIAGGQFELHYQPIVQVVPVPGAQPPRVDGVEALARWRHPRLGLLSPAAFLPLAEQSGAIVDLDLWALRTAVAAAAGWPTDGHAAHVAVNLSAQTLVDPRLPGVVREALCDSRVAPARLILEVIESRTLADLPGVAARLTQLRQLGVRISLDDFGTGYSTLTWLHRLPIDQIKLDRSFLCGAHRDGDAPDLVEGVLALAHTLGIEVVAEGIENVEQFERLRTIGCERVQGYLFGRPTPIPVLALTAHPAPWRS